ncbi:MAG: outer membrane protein assembly factor BamB family protein [Planctomycetaceae bacterium]
MTRGMALLLLVCAAASAEEWLLPRGDLENSGVVKNKGPKREPALVWRRDEGQPILGGAALVGGRLIYAVGEEKVACRLAKSGVPVWDKVVKRGVLAWPVVQGNLLFFGGQDHVFYRVQLDTGGEPMSAEAKGPIVATAAVTETHYLAGSLDGRLYAMSPKEGRVLWNTEVGPVRLAATVGRTAVYVVNDEGTVHALDLKQGRILWTHASGAHAVAAPLLSAAALYLPIREAVLALNPKTGAVLRRHATPGIAGAPVLEKTSLHYGTEGGELVTLELGEDKGMRRIKMGDAPISVPLLLAGKMLYGASGSALFAFDCARGEQAWTFRAEAPFLPPIVADGFLYAGAGNVFYCLR